MQKLWEKKYQQDANAEQYCFGDNVVLDNRLVVHDVYGSIAHALMLEKIGILTHKECEKILSGLRAILHDYASGNFVVGSGDEDVHTKVETYLTEALGDVGKKLHTARSRNDQVLVDLRLYTKEQLIDIAQAGLPLAGEFTQYAKTHECIPMPGYTHMQKAMPSSVGMWAGSFAESLLDDIELAGAAYGYNDQSPLGSGASYGVSLPVDRELTAKLLGFSKVQNNSLYAQVSRGKSHLSAMHACVQIMLTLSRFAQDVLLFTTAEFSFFTITDNMTTGSSIMPQKKNLDVAEIIRAKTHEVIGYEQTVASIISGLPSGYNADFGETKYPLIKSIEITLGTLSVCKELLSSITPNQEIMENACTPELYAAHAAYQLVKSGTPFREAYHTIGKQLDFISKYNPKKILKESTHTGGTGNLGLSKLEKIITGKKNIWVKKKQIFEKTLYRLAGSRCRTR